MKYNEKDFIKEITVLLLKRKCALFVGSGFTADCGGATWNELLDFLKLKFHYQSPLENPFDIMTDLIKKNEIGVPPL